MAKRTAVTEKEATEQQAIALRMMSESYETKLEQDMGQLHNQFVAFIASAKLPLPQVLLVLQILIKETVDQAYGKYLEG